MVARQKEFIATTLTGVYGDYLRSFGLDSGAAEPWAFGITGLVQSTGEWWLDRRSMSRAQVTDYVSQLIWWALTGVLREAGIAADPDAPVPAGRPVLAPGRESAARLPGAAVTAGRGTPAAPPRQTPRPPRAR